MSNEKLSAAKQALLEKWLKGQVQAVSPGIPKRPADQGPVLSFPQRRQLFLELLERGTAVNNLSTLIQLKGDLNLKVLEQSAQHILARHETLRTRFVFGMGLPTPEVLPEVELPFPVVDLQGVNPEDQEKEAIRLAEKEVLQPFDLRNAPLLRLKLYTLSHNTYFLLLTVHHTIADGWSLGVLLREWMQLYRTLCNNEPVSLTPLPIQYADFAYWQTDPVREESRKTALEYWQKQLAGELPLLELPTDQTRGARQTFTGGTHRFTLDARVSNALEKLGRTEDATLFMVLLTAFFILLHRYSGQDEIMVGTPTASRNQPELEPLIGVFINTLVLRGKVPADAGFRSLLQYTKKLALEAYAHQDLPFEKLVEVLKPQRDLSRTPLFQALFNLQNSPLPRLEFPGLESRFIDINRGVAQFDLSLMFTKVDGHYHAAVEYNQHLFKAESIARMFQSYLLILEQITANPDLPITQLALIPNEEKQHLLIGFNQTRADFPREKCFHQLFEAQVERSPQAIALEYEQNCLTYNELNQSANALARHLLDLGLNQGGRVGILMERSAEILVALLAVGKAGGVYVPLNPLFPAERLQFILEDAQVQFLLSNLQVPFHRSPVEVISVPQVLRSAPAEGTNLNLPISAQEVAYIMYTSGSTGQPKGVVVQHVVLVNFLCSMLKCPGITESDVLLSVTAISFDIAALELYLPLLVGARVIIASQHLLANPVLLAQAITERQVSLMQATPATWQLLLEAGWPGAKDLKALCGGDVLSRSLANQLLSRVGSLWNMYGPTETTIWSSVAQIFPDGNPITIGNPIANTQLYVLDTHLQLVPPGVIGELYIGGEGLAQGYLNRDALTHEKFIPDPFNTQAGARLYKTGDRARYRLDSIEVLGRNDDQIKLNGNRIELGEINTLMVRHPAVQDAVVIARSEKSGLKHLIAYYVAAPGQTLAGSELRDFLREKLPAYMIPALFIELDKMPLNANGKIDRKALPPPTDHRRSTGYQAPHTAIEKVLTSIWQDVLQVEQVGVNDNFFDLGGASIQSLQIVAKANMLGFPLRIDHIFEYQTIADLAAFLQMEQ